MLGHKFLKGFLKFRQN